MFIIPNYVTKLRNLNAINKGGEPRYTRPNSNGKSYAYRHIMFKTNN